MSVKADFRLIEISKLEGLREAVMPKKSFFGKAKDMYFEFLEKNSIKLKEYNWSGYVYATLLPFLEENGIILMKSNHDDLSSYITNSRNSTTFIFTNTHKDNYIEKLNPARFNEKELAEYYNDFNGTDEDTIGKAMIDGIEVLFNNLQKLDHNKVILFGIY